MTTRTITFEWIICCYDDRVAGAEVDCLTEAESRAWVSPWNKVIVPEEMDVFPESLVLWRDRMLEEFDELAKEEGEADCQDIYESLHLCDYRIRVVNVEEEVVKVPVPPEIIDAIKAMEKIIKDLRDAAEKYKGFITLREDFISRADALQKQVDDMRKKYNLEGVVL